MQFRLLTYNIHKGIGGIDRLYRLERIITTIQHYHPDIIMLQEVDDNVPRSKHHRQVDEISEALGMQHRAFQRNVKLTKGYYGNAIISKFPLVDVENINLTIPLKKRRRALVAHCLLRDETQKTILLINCHLGLAGFERSIQLGKILENPRVNRTHHKTPIIVGGDYNDVWGNLGVKCMEPAGFSSINLKVNTFPAIMPVRQLDHIYYKGALDFIHSYPGHTALARHASDHLPLIADFKI
jgi:endonuclease/exonuclease/phosphatase family metal-dependent hydrolase